MYIYIERERDRPVLPGLSPFPVNPVQTSWKLPTVVFHNDFFTFHGINISKQIEFVLFLSPSGIAFSPMTCAHLSPRAPLVKPLMHKNLAFLFECLFYDPPTSPLK